jgi:hypothetical protein
MHKYNNQDHAMMTGLLTAHNILAGRQVYDAWDVNEDAEYHEGGVAGASEALASERLVPRRVAGAQAVSHRLTAGRPGASVDDFLADRANDSE